MKETSKRSDYAAICKENERKYGTDIGRIGKMLLADRYADRTHFIFELLQNAEDALAKRSGENQNIPASIKFDISESSLVVSHYGKLFDENDVKGVCGIAESTKNELTAIGRFGIGFKSVYSFTDIPEIHSGNEHFAIDNYVLPKEIPAIELEENETKIILPLNQEKKLEYYNEIVLGIKRINLNCLLFLRHIEEIEWSANGEDNGVFMRSKPNQRGDNVREIELIGQTNIGDITSGKYLVFSKEVSNERNTGLVEIAFLMNDKKIQVVPHSPLVVFFPTEKQTALGFLVQGPYRTTPSRDNIPTKDEWNKKCVSVTGELVVESLHWLRDNNMLDIEGLRCYPIDKINFDSTNMFSSLYDIVKTAFINEPLLPRYKGGYVSANESLIARTKELRELLFNAQGLSDLYNGKNNLLQEEISEERNLNLRNYLIKDIGVNEITPDKIISKIDSAFLKKQDNKWIRDFYEFLSKQKDMYEKLKSMPIIRLSNYEHIVPFKNGKPQVFLPGQETEFPTVHKEVCGDEKSGAFAFLKAIGLTEPNPVDDVILNILPKFDESPIPFTEETYKQTIQRILMAFDTDSTSQKEKLISELKNKKFVAVINAATGEKDYTTPDIVYFQTESFKSLFDGVDSIYFVNEQWGLKGEKPRELLEKCGVYRNLRPIEKHTAFSHTDSHKELSEVRQKEGLSEYTWQKIENNNTLYGLEELLIYFEKLSNEEKAKRSRLIWKELGNLYERRRESVFLGTYSWGHGWLSRKAGIDPYFIRILNKTAWIPDHEGNLHTPSAILFNSLGWDDNIFLRSKILFKSDEIQEFEEKTGYKAVPQNEYEQFKKWQEAQKIQSNTNEKSKNEFIPALSVADAPLQVSDFTGKDQSIPFDESQLNKSVAQTSDTNSTLISKKDSNSKPTSDNNNSSEESSVNSEYQKKEGRYGEEYVLKLLNEEYKDNINNVDIIDLNKDGKIGKGADVVVKDKTSGKTIKLVEVKSTTGLKGSEQRISGVQWETARKEGDLYWIYCVYNVKNNPEVVRIQNPIQKWKDGLLFADPVDFVINPI
jgi:hypothetical protein